MSQCVIATNRDVIKAVLEVRRVQISGSSPNFTVGFPTEEDRYHLLGMSNTRRPTKSLDLRQNQSIQQYIFGTLMIVVFIDGQIRRYKSHAAS